MMTAASCPLDNPSSVHSLSEASLESLLDRAFNTHGSTLNRQPFSLVLANTSSNGNGIHDQLVQDAILHTIIKRTLPQLDYMILRMAYLRNLTTSDVWVIYSQLQARITQIKPNTNCLPPRFITMAILSALRKQNLFHNALNEITDEKPSRTHQRALHRYFLAYHSATQTWINQAKANAQVSLCGYEHFLSG